MTAHPLLCLGHVTHRRLRPAVNAFTYPVFYVQLPLRSLMASQRGIFSVDRWNLLSFFNRDHGPRDGSPLLPWIEGVLADHGLPSGGEIILQSFPRVLGYAFNPVSFWYCYAADEQLIAILVEVNNTFGGTHCYLLHRAGAALRDGEELRAEKCFHVSPFNEIEGNYRFRFRRTGRTQSVRIDYDDTRGPLLLTAISGTPQVWSSSGLLRAFLRMPLLTTGVMVRIHWQALKLWLKGVPFHGAHPPARPRQESTR